MNTSRSCAILILALALSGSVAASPGAPAPSPSSSPAVVAPASPAVAEPDSPSGVAPAPSPIPVDFRSALKAAVDSSPELEARRARVEQAHWSTEEAAAAGNPQFGVEGTYTRLEPEQAINFGGRSIVIAPADSYKAAFILRQAVATFGRLHYSVLAGKMAERAALEEYRQALTNELATTADAYLVGLLAEEEVSIAQQQLASREASLRDADALFEAGSVARFDVLRARSEVTRARQIVVEATNRLKIAEARLASRMGLPSGVDLALAPVSFDDPPPVEMAAAMEQALSRRPEIRALGWALESARARVGLAQSATRPVLNLQTQATSQTSSGFAQGEQWVTGLVLGIPFYDGGAARAQEGRAREAVRELEAGMEQTRRSVRLDVENAYLNLNSRWERIGQARQGLLEAEEAARVAEVRYQAGLSTSTELIEAQTALVQARQALAAARYGYLGAAVAWTCAVSGEYPVEVPGPLAPTDLLPPGMAPSLNPPPTSAPPAQAQP